MSSHTLSNKISNFWVFISEVVGLLMQFGLLIYGTRFVFFEEDQLEELGLLLFWCLIATIYLFATALWVNIDLHLRKSESEVLRGFFSGVVVRWFSVLVTFSASLVGLTAATALILGKGNPDRIDGDELLAVWAMLLSWALFHWGYARIYHSFYHRAAEPPIKFPGTTEPRLSDFAYFSFINGTSFAPADATIVSSRMRWTVVWHTTFSFFFNALIIVLTMNTISGGFSPA